MNLRKINTASLRLMRMISGFTYLLIGIDAKHNRYYVVSSQTGEKYRLCVGIVANIVGSMLTVLGGFAFLILPAAILESAPVIDWTVGLQAFRALGMSAAVAYVGNKIDMLFAKRPDLYDEDFEPTDEWLEKWIY